MLSTERSTEANFLLARDGYDLYEVLITPPKVTWLWRKLNQYRTLFSDLTRGSLENFVAFMMRPNTYWMDVYSGDEIVGCIYVEHLMEDNVDCEAHVMFFDRRLHDKVNLARAALQYIFDTFRVHRITVTMPSLYWPTRRFAQRVGFQYEGTKRQVYLLDGVWHDEVILGILNGEVADGRVD
jgi:RimJ/RimL family protein N-acetyltransferase